MDSHRFIYRGSEVGEQPISSRSWRWVAHQKGRGPVWVKPPAQRSLGKLTEPSRHHRRRSGNCCS